MNVRIEELSSIAKKLHFEVGAKGRPGDRARFCKIGQDRKSGVRRQDPLGVLEQYYGGQMKRSARPPDQRHLLQGLDDHAIPGVGEHALSTAAGSAAARPSPIRPRSRSSRP